MHTREISSSRALYITIDTPISDEGKGDGSSGEPFSQRVCLHVCDVDDLSSEELKFGILDLLMFLLIVDVELLPLIYLCIMCGHF